MYIYLIVIGCIIIFSYISSDFVYIYIAYFSSPSLMHLFFNPAVFMTHIHIYVCAMQADLQSMNVHI